MTTVPIDCHPDKLSGQTCIAGTRIPVTTLFNWLAIGGTIHNFGKEYPRVTPEQAHDVVTFAGRDAATRQNIEWPEFGLTVGETRTIATSNSVA